MSFRHALLAAFFLSSCSSFARTDTQTAIPPLTTQEVVGTIVASGPMIELSFDGEECTIRGQGELPVGNVVTRFANSSGHIATAWVARCYPGKTWQDVLDWIGPPGAVFHKETTPWLALPGHGRSVSETSTVTYSQYDLAIAADYAIFVEYPSDYLWPCGPFRVVATP